MPTGRRLAAQLMTAGTVLGPSLALAQPWSGDLSLGYLATSGNSTSRSFNSKSVLVYVRDQWKNTTSASAVDAYSEHVSSAEAYAAENQTDYEFTPQDYALLALEWNLDRFAPVRERVSESVGYGRHVLSGPAHQLDVELGAGARQSTTNDTPREHKDELIGRAALKYAWVLTPTSSFHQSLKLESGNSNSYFESLSELKLAIVGNLFASFSYTVKNNSEVAENTRHTDTYTAVNLSYTFGKSQ